MPARRRCLAQAIVCLALGLVAAIAVAWLASTIPGTTRWAAGQSYPWYEDDEGVWLVSTRTSRLETSYGFAHAFDDDDAMWQRNREDIRAT